MRKFRATMIVALVLQSYSFDLKLYNKIGVAIENLADNVIVTHGYQTIPLRVEMRLPSIESGLTKDRCNAAENKTFVRTVELATSRFREQIQKELSEFINLEDMSRSEPHRRPTHNAVNVSADDVAKNPSLCDKDNIKCKFFPLMDEPQDDIKEYQARACYDSTLGEVNPSICKIQNGTTVCCAKRASKNKGNCPREELSESLAIVNRQDIRFPQRIHKFSHGDVPANRINNFCLALLWVEIDGVRTTIGPFSESNVFDQDTSRNRRDAEDTSSETHSRQRRSNWQYYTSGGWFTSNYIDNQVSQVKDIVTANDNELRSAIDKNSKVLLTLQADHQEKEHLRQAICSASEHLSEELVLTELRSSQSKLEFKSELMLRSCSSQIVPDQIDSALLTKLCTSQSNSPHCYGKAVRSIFSCELTKPLISMEVVGVAMILTMSIPLDESYDSFRIHSIGVPYRSDAVDVQTNISIAKAEKKPIENNLNVEEALRNIFSQLGKSRNRRELVSTYHFLRVNSLPDIVISYENDLITFMDKDCIETPFGLVADYSNNIVEDSECVKSIFDSSIPRITHFCSVTLESSNFPCQVHHIGRIGYLVSTSDRMEITDVSLGQKSVFNNKIDGACDNTVCAVTVSNAAKRFKCGRRVYRVGSHEEIHVDIKTEKLAKIQITGLTARKTDRSELILSGFNMLDRIPMINKQILRKSSTLSTILTLLVSCFMSIVCLRYFMRRSISMIWRRSKRALETFFRSKKHGSTSQPIYNYHFESDRLEKTKLATKTSGFNGNLAGLTQ